MDSEVIASNPQVSTSPSEESGQSSRPRYHISQFKSDEDAALQTRDKKVRWGSREGEKSRNRLYVDIPEAVQEGIENWLFSHIQHVAAISSQSNPELFSQNNPYLLTEGGPHYYEKLLLDKLSDGKGNVSIDKVRNYLDQANGIVITLMLMEHQAMLLSFAQALAPDGTPGYRSSLAVEGFRKFRGVREGALMRFVRNVGAGRIGGRGEGISGPESLFDRGKEDNF